MVVWDVPPSQVTKTPQESFTFCRDSFRETGEPTSSGCLNRSPWKHLFFSPGHVCFSSMTDLLSALVWGLETSKHDEGLMVERIWHPKVVKPLKMGDPKMNVHLPTIHVQGRAVKLRGVFIDLPHMFRDVNQNSVHFQVWLAGDAFLYQKGTWIHLHVWRYYMVCWKEHR